MTWHTVLVLRPDSMWDGHQSDWVLRQHIHSTEPTGSCPGFVGAYEATIANIALEAKRRAAAFDEWDGDVDDYAVLAVYPGKLTDEYVNTATEPELQAAMRRKVERGGSAIVGEG